MKTNQERRVRRRRWPVLYAAGFAASLLAVVVVANCLAHHSALRVHVDATKTRAYSLSDQTRQLLHDLEGEWKIALIVSRENTDRTVSRQIDEVLGRYTDASPPLSVSRIDPDDARTFRDYEKLILDLQTVYKQPIDQYDRALDAGIEALDRLRLFAQEQGAWLEQVVASLAANDPARAPLEQHLSVLSLLPDQCSTILDQVAKARRIDQSRPLPDFDTARSLLAYALSQGAVELDETAQVLGKLAQRGGGDAGKQIAVAAQQSYQQLSQRLAETADPLKRLPPLELGTIGAQLQQGEAAVIISPKRAAVIPSAQLFPKSNLQQKSDGGVSFDQRFRGEQLISAAIRSLTVEHMPLVVFVHGESTGLLRPRDKQADLVGVGSVLKASRYDVAEWSPGGGAQQAQRPGPQQGQPVVWVIVPPPQRQGLELSKNELELLSAVRQLIADGENVLLSVYPSSLTKYGQSDPWAELTGPLAMRPDTSRVIFESVRVGDDRSETQRGKAISNFAGDHLVARAVNGQQAYFGLPMPIEFAKGASGKNAATHSVIASIGPSADRWLESNWAADPSALEEPTPQQRFNQSLPIVAAAQRANPVKEGSQRVVLVGSGGWMLSYVADVVVPVSGGRMALVNPGNYELMLASISWLAGMDELIAASPLSQQVQRLEGVSVGTQMMWMAITVGVLPIGCLGLGVVVWMMRRG